MMGDWAAIPMDNGPVTPRKMDYSTTAYFRSLEDAQANLWMSSNRGIYRVSKQQLTDVAAGKRRSLITVSYGRADGMQNVECNGGLWPAGAKDKDGKLWFPTQEGVAVVDPESVPVNQRPPRVVIESADLDHTPADLEKPVTITSRAREPGNSVHCAEFFQARTDRLSLHDGRPGYELAGRWISPYCLLLPLPPGSYTFRVMAANSDGVWSTIQSSLPVTVLPPFYLTRWFLVVMFALAFGLLYYAVESSGQTIEEYSSGATGFFSTTHRIAGERASSHLGRVAR